MCGINGIYKFSGIDYSDKLIMEMNKAMAHRGPDADKIFTDNYVHFGHRRLSIIDTDERADQPFLSHDKRFVLIFNGEIYNYNEIKKSLSDYNFTTNSDTEVLLAAYMKWGEHCLQHLNGMFAFAIWDSEEKTLFIARDRLGIKPLYYYLDNEQIVFSSSLKSILSTDLVDRKLSQKALIDYLRFQTVHAPYTIIDDVFMLEPGQYMMLTQEKQFIKSYWKPEDKFQYVAPDLETIKSEIRNKLSSAVKKRLMSDVPFGAFLSGGIDSSIIVALMAENQDSKVDTFSITFKEDEFSESKYAKIIAEKYQTNHHEIELSVNEFMDLIPEGLNYLDHPSGDGLNTFVVSKKTKEAGITMALSGLGGDELFGGYSIFKQIPDIQNKNWLSSFPNYARKQLGTVYDLVKNNVASSKIKAILKQEYFDTEYVYQFYRQVLMDDQISKLVNKRPLPLNRTFEIAHEQIGYGTKGWSLPPLSRISVAEFSTYMSNVLLRDSDQMSMASALEVRVPFLDHELIEYVLGIPDDIKEPITPKKLLVDSFKELIPEEIYNREKMGFVLPYEKWMKNELKSFCETNLEVLKKLKFFNSKAIDKLWNKFLKGNKKVTWSRIWPLVILGNWIELNQIHE